MGASVTLNVKQMERFNVGLERGQAVDAGFGIKRQSRAHSQLLKGVV